MSRRWRWVGVTTLVLCGVIVVILVVRRNESGAASGQLDAYGQLPAFELRDQADQPFTRDALAGSVTIANFIFTRCTTVCPTLSQQMRRIVDATVELGENLRFVSFSVDPEYDTPARLAAFAKRYAPDDSRWSFVTGDPAAIRATVRGGLQMSMERDGTLQTNGAPNIAHSGYFVLIDRTLRIRGYYDSGDNKRMQQLLRDATGLVRDAPSNR